MKVTPLAVAGRCRWVTGAADEYPGLVRDVGKLGDG
jgi:hypothetical protein